MDKQPQNKIIVIGLDGATFDLILPWIKTGELPQFARFINEGAYGGLKSTIPPISAPAWVSFMTGKNPAKHGIINFFIRNRGQITSKGATYTPVKELLNVTHIDSPTVWEILSQNGKKVGVINCPMTYPPINNLNGFIIPGMMTPPHTELFTYPEELSRELRKVGYQIDLKLGDWYGFIPPDHDMGNAEYFEQLYEIEKKRAEVSIQLYNKYDPNFFTVVFTGMDRILHFFWKYLDKKDKNYAADNLLERDTLKYLKMLDSVIGQFSSIIQDEGTMLIMSDHGFGPVEKERIHLNSVLRQNGLLQYSTRTSLKGRILGNIKSIVEIFHLNDFVKKLISKETKQKMFTEPEWSKTKAYFVPLISNFGGVNINLEGREPRGIVNKSEYEKLREQIIKKLKIMKHPKTNEYFFEKVHKKEELYSGKHIDLMPDIICIAKEKYGFSPYDQSGHPVVAPAWRDIRTGTHKMEGIFMAKGNSIAKGQGGVQASIVDLAPTILYLMGIPIPEAMDGQVIEGIIPPKLLDSRPIQYYRGPNIERTFLEQEKGNEGNDKVEERLKSLGYL